MGRTFEKLARFNNVAYTSADFNLAMNRRYFVLLLLTDISKAVLLKVEELNIEH